MSEGYELTGLERHEGEQLMTEFEFWGELAHFAITEMQLR